MTSDDVRLIAVGTHHKTGTVWLKRVFMEVTKALNLPRHQIRARAAEDKIPSDGRRVLVSWHSTFSDTLRTRSDLRGIHMIRDPRDVLVSGARYHLNAPKWRENWLYQPSKDFGGKTYHECITGFTDWSDQLLFEMEHMHLETLKQMREWDYSLSNWYELRYEDLIEDSEMKLFSNAADFLGFQADEKDVVMRAYWNNSVFGGLSKGGEPGAKTATVGGHIKSGAPSQWKSKLPRSVAEVYSKRFGEDLRALGYAEDDSWVAECDPSSEGR